MTIHELTDKTDIENLIRLCWGSDKELLGKYHVCAGDGLIKCVENTINAFENNVDKETFKFFQVAKEHKIIGFFGMEKWITGNFLTTFFVFPELRTKEILKEYMQLIDEMLEIPYHTAIYDNNTRAEKFLERNGFMLKEKFPFSGNTTFVRNILLFRKK